MAPFYKFKSKIAALVLCVTVFIATMPAAVWAEETQDEEVITEEYLVFASDRHGDEEAIGTAMSTIPDQYGDLIGYVGMIGDMVGSGGSDAPSYNTSTVLEEVQEVFPLLDKETVSIVYGSHDAGATDDAGIMKCWCGEGSSDSSGTSDLIYTEYNEDGSVAYYVYGIAYDDMLNTNSTAQSEAEQFIDWVSSLEDQTTPIIVTSHVPIHAKRGDNLGASYWNEALNYAATGSDSGIAARRPVVFLHGHNHTNEQVEYYYEPGSTITVQQTSKSSKSESEIFYTYITAGYMKGMSTKNATLIAIEGDTLTFTKYNSGTPSYLGEASPFMIAADDIRVYQGTSSAKISYEMYKYGDHIDPDSVAFSVSEDTDKIIDSIDDDGTIAFSGSSGSAEVVIEGSYQNRTFSRSITVTAVALSGTCGDSLTWNFDPETGCLTIEGSGEMTAYTSGTAPWYELAEEIRTVVLPEGITSIGAYAFSDCTGITEIVLPDGVTTIGKSAFSGASSLATVTVPGTLTSVARSAFNNTALTDVYYYGSSTDWSGITVNSSNSALTSAAMHYLMLLTITSEYCTVTVTDTAGNEYASGDYVEAGTELSITYVQDEDTLMTETPESSITVGEEAVEIRAIAILHTHTFGDPVYTWSDDYSTVTATRSCIPLCGLTETETVNTVKVTEDPTCTETGSDTYTAEFENAAFETQTKIVEIAALGHDWADPEYTWADDLSSVTATRVCKRDAGHIETETVKTTVMTVDPTCTETGLTTYTATFENSAFADQTEEVVIAALGHDWGEPTYEWAEDHSTVTATRVCKHDTSHIETETVNTEIDASGTMQPTCTETGLTTYTATFENSAFTKQTAEVVTEALGHDYAATVTDPTCTEKGYTTHVCTRCGDTYIDSYTDALGHTPGEAVKENIVEATCEETGSYDEVVYCTVCGEELSRENVTTEATGHDWGEPAYVWAEDNSTVTATRVCQNDKDHVETETADTTVVTVDPTCTETGLNTYTANFKNSAFAEQTKSVEIDALGHDYESVVTAPTCTTKGYTTHTCSRCGDSYVDTLVNELGHDWDEPTYVWVEDLSSVTATRICRSDPSHVETETSETVVTTADPTCTDTGLTTYTATFENSGFAEQTKEVVIDALGHDYEAAVTAPTCTEQGYTTHTCTRCGDSYVDTYVDALGHTEGEAVKENIVEATCEETGSYDEVVYCTVCGEELSRETKTIAAIGHDWGEPTYEWSEDYSTMTATRVCLNDAAHVETETVKTSSETVAPTCIAIGLITYTATFSNEAFEKQTAKVVIDALGHDYEAVVTAPTCTEQGYTTHTCTRCGDSYIDTYVDALGHTEGEAVKENLVDATCEENGSYEEVVYCTVCGEELSRETRTIKATGHDWGDPIYVWADDLSSVTATRVCNNDPSHIETETAETSVTTEEPTCTETGLTTYTAVFENSAFSEQIREIPIEALGHDYKAAVTDPTCTTKGYTTHTCTRCSDSYIDTYVDALGHTSGEAVKENIVEATCEENGSYEEVVYCTVCGDELSREKMSIAALGHDYIHHEAKEATCTEIGWEAYDTCSRCDYTTYVEIPAKGHTIVTDEAVEPTCTTTGITQGSHCSVCGEIILAQAEIPALGHDYEAIVTAPTCTEKGYTTHTCTRCGDSYIDTYVDALGHTEGAAVKENIIDATCEENGSYEEVVYCTVCGEELSRETKTIEATGHDWGEPTYEWSEDYSTVTATRVCLNDAAHVETETVKTSSETADPTCTETGLITYTATFSNEAFEKQTAKVVIDKLGHDYEAVITAPTCTEKGYTTHTCTRCGDSYIDTYVDALGHTAGEAVKENIIEATCEENGSYEEVVYCTVCGKELSRETRTIKATGHDWGEPTYEWSSDNSTVTATRVCNNDPAHIETETVKTSSETVDPTCTETGLTTYTATFSNEAFEKQTKKVVIDKLGHNYESVVTDPTCTTKGYTTHTCTRCGSSYVDTYVDALGHTEGEAVKENIVEATCEENGSYEEVVYCSVCGEELSRETKTIAAIGHDWAEPSYEWSEDYSTVTATRVCQNDPDHVETETADALITTVDPTCTETGLITYTATFSNDAFETKTVEVKTDALGHTLVKTEASEPTTEKTGNTEYWTCSECGKFFSDAEGKNEIEKDSWIIPVLEPTEEEIAKADLDTVVADAKTVSNEDGTYTAESYQALQDAIAEAERIAADENSTAAQLREAQAAVEAAKASLVTVEEERAQAAEELNEAITEVKAISNDDGKYTADSYQALQNAIAEAERIAADENSTAAQLREAQASVEAAVSALVEEPLVVLGNTYKYAKQYYKVTRVATDSLAGTVTFTKAKNAKSISVPKTIVLADGLKYKVTKVGSKAFTSSKIRKVTIGAYVSKLTGNAFAKSKATKIILKTKKLTTKAKVKGCLKSSKVKVVQVKVGTKAVNKKYVKKYKKVFTKANAGKAVTVK